MIEFKINGKQRGFRFGTYTFKLINQAAGKDVPVEETLDKLSKETGMLEQLETLASICFACAKHYAIAKKEEIDFTEADIYDWIDERGLITTVKDIEELTDTWKGSIQKNLRALETGHPLPSSNGQLSPSLS